MPARKLLIICVASSLVLALFPALFLLHTGPALFRGGYAVLELDESFPDHEAVSLLHGAGIEDVVSESGQWVYLDNFGELRKIPLDRYGEFVESFDPRNDGYAEKLRSFFINQGRRLLFIPLSGGNGKDYGTLSRVVPPLFAGIPFSLKTLNPLPSPWLPLLFSLAAAALSLIFFRRNRLIPFLLPLFTVFSFCGPSGLASAALLAGLSELLAPPLRDFFILRRYKGNGLEKSGIFRLVGARDNRRRLLLAGVFFLFYPVVCLWGGLAASFSLVGLASCVLISCCVLWAESNFGGDEGHIRFTPVPIYAHVPLKEILPVGMLPLGLAAGCALLVSLLSPSLQAFPGAGELPEEGPLISAADFEAHVRFQTYFSLSPLGASAEDGDSPPYYRYYQDGTGLIGGKAAPDILSFRERGPEVFPLGELLTFLSEPPEPSAGYSRGGTIAAVLISLLLSLVSFIKIPVYRRKKRSFSVYNDKRIAA